MWMLIVLACGQKEPDWLVDCDCTAGEVCVWGGGAECQVPPPECEAAFAGACDLSKLDDACTAALCGYELGDTGEIAGTTSIEAECWETEENALERWFDCKAPLTF